MGVGRIPRNLPALVTWYRNGWQNGQRPLLMADLRELHVYRPDSALLIARLTRCGFDPGRTARSLGIPEETSQELLELALRRLWRTSRTVP
jgi:hypothetical protein